LCLLQLVLAPVFSRRLIRRTMKPIASSFAFITLLPSVAIAADFLEPFEHVHSSQLGTPYVHSFGIEPASTGRDLFLDYSYRDGNGISEHESELELEWAFTRRLGVIMEVPYIWEDEEDVATASGFGDFTLVPRALLVESERFLLTAQVEVALPTGSSRFGGETAIAPGVAMWNDLGNWWTINTNLAIEHVFDADSTELLFGVGLVKSIGEKCENHAKHDGHAHSTAGLLNFHLEVTGVTPLNGDDEGEFNIEGLVGISHSFTAGFDIRAGYMFPITSPKDFDKGFTAGVILHF
jgi:hypothetical protein